MNILRKTSLMTAGFAAAIAFMPGIGAFSAGDVKAEFPSKPIKIYVGFKPGGRTDTVARLIAKHITDKKMLSQPIVIVNKPGAAAANAARAVLRAKPDGHSILHWSHQMLVANAMNVNKIHPENFTTIGYTGGGSPVWTVRKDAPFNSLKELVDALKAKPRSLVEAVGIGTIPHLIGVQLVAAAGVKTRLIGSGGGADRLARLLGKNADIALFSAAGYLKHKPSGIKALVFFGPNRIPSIKDIPTAKELGYNVVWANPASWLGPKGMPKAVVAKWASVLKQAIESEEISAYYKSKALDPYWTGGEAALQDSLRVLATLKKVVVDNKITKKKKKK